MESPADSWLNSRQRLAVVASFATMLMVGVTISLLGPSLPGLAERSGIALPRAGIFFSFFAAGSVLATLAFARLMDRPVRHILVTAGALSMGGALWLVAGSQTFAQSSVAITVTGLAMSTAGTAPNAIIADLYRMRAGQALNVLHVCAGLGTFVGPLLVASSIRLGGDYTAVFRLAGWLALLVGLVWIFSRPPRPQRAGSDAGVSKGILLPLASLLFFAMLYVGTEQAFGGWLFTYARQTAGMDAALASLLTALFWLAVLSGRLGAVGILRRMTNFGLLMRGVVLGAFGIGAVLLGSTTTPLLWPGVILVGLGLGPIFPTTLALSTELAPNRAGAASSLVVAAGSVGAMMLPYASGALMLRTGIVGSMASLLAPLAAMLACLWVIGQLSRHRRIPGRNIVTR